MIKLPTLQEWTKALEDQILASLTPSSRQPTNSTSRRNSEVTRAMAANTELMLVQGRPGTQPGQQDGDVRRAL